LSSSTTNYSYDYDEQLTQVVSPLTGTSSFTYDGLGRRVSRTNGGTTTTFHFSGNNITTEKQGSTVVAHYVYGNSRVSRDASGSYEYYHNDGLGSTRQISNDSQSVTQTTTFDAFGNVESSTGSSNNVYKYAGQWGYRNDGDDGLMHMGARYYDPLVGRFLSADTWLGEITRPQSLNRYAYCENNPVSAVDPTGRRIKPILRLLKRIWPVILASPLDDIIIGKIIDPLISPIIDPFVQVDIRSDPYHSIGGVKVTVTFTELPSLGGGGGRTDPNGYPLDAVGRPIYDRPNLWTGLLSTEK
jgi:RHS repeat-associated protein